MTARVHMEVARAENALAVREAALRFTPPDAAEATESRARVWRVRSAPNELESVAVKAGISDGMFTAIEVAPGAALHASDEVAIGLLHPDQTMSKPSVSLGGK
jgi:hypothetical protein